MSHQRRVTSNNFGGLVGQIFEMAQAVILPVPYEGTVSYGTGASKGPEAIIQASRFMEWYDLELDAEIYKNPGIFTMEPMAVSSLPPEEMTMEVEKEYARLVAANKFVVMLGGEHSISYAADRPWREKYSDLSVLQWDAHADLKDFFEGTKFSHGCAIRRFYDHAKRIVQVGIRSYSAEEAEYIKKNNLRDNIFTPSEFDVERIVSRLSPNVYVTVDLDGFDPAVVPATGTPEPGGLFWPDFLRLMRAVFAKRNVVGCDVVELAPIAGQPASDFLAASAAHKMIGYKFCQ